MQVKCAKNCPLFSLFIHQDTYKLKYINSNSITPVLELSNDILRCSLGALWFSSAKSNLLNHRTTVYNSIQLGLFVANEVRLRIQTILDQLLWCISEFSCCVHTYKI